MIINSRNELPVYDHRLEARPSELLTGPIEPVLLLAEQVISNDAKTLADYAIHDRTTREEIINHRLAAALLRTDIDAVKAAASELRAIQDRGDRKLTMGLVEEIAVAALASHDPAATAGRLAEARLSLLPYNLVDAWMKGERAALATANPNLVLGQVRTTLDPIAEKNGGLVDQPTAAAVVAARAARDRLYPVAPQIAAAMAQIVDANSTGSTTDIWAARQVTLDESFDAKPITIAIWDSGVDMNLFPPAADSGMAIDGEGHAVPDLLRPTPGYTERLPELLDLAKGLFDLRAGQMTPAAEAYQSKVATLKPEEVKEFSESLGFMFNYLHGTHVAGIAVAGNPFARIQAVSMHFPHRQEDMKLDRAISERRAAFYREAIERMLAAGTRVVNMSWRLGPAIFESILATQGGTADAIERKQLAAELFAIEKSALEKSIRAAPDILFVAGAGNEGNDAGFSDYIPAGLSIPNLITVGAVDRAGREAIFTSVGGTVVIYANGVEIEAVVPGGQRRAFSGTSMASPQVANAAAKLAAMRPELSGAQLRQLLIDTATTEGRVKLLNTREAFAKAGINAALPT